MLAQRSFAYPRFAIASGSEHKAFVPFSPMLPSPHRILRANALSLSPSTRTLTLDRPIPGASADSGSHALSYDALVLATGTKLSPPGTMPGKGDKAEGVKYLQSIQGELEKAGEIIIVGGGAVGVRASPLALSLPPRSP